MTWRHLFKALAVWIVVSVPVSIWVGRLLRARSDEHDRPPVTAERNRVLREQQARLEAQNRLDRLGPLPAGWEP